MNRLLQGEVGSGKTLVALRAMLRVVDSGGQAALLAPTEVLAQQHHRSITAMLGDLAGGGISVGRGRHGRAAHRLDDQDPAHRAAVPARERRGRDRDRHPRAAGGPGPVRRPRPGRGRRAAPVRRRAARRAHRQGARHAAARAGDDRDADPAHRRDDGLRRPRGLDARRAAGRPGGDPDQRGPLAEHPGWMDRVWARVREEVEKGHQAYVVCPRISGDEPRPAELDGDRTTTRAAPSTDRPLPRGGRGRRRRARPPTSWPACGSPRCTAGCRPTRRTAPCAPSPPARSTSWSRRR